MIAQYSGADRKLAYLFENAREVSISPILTTGTQIATLTIDDQTYTLYCTTGGGGGSTVSYNSLISSGTALGELTIDGVKYTIYSKDSSKVSYAATQASGQQIGTLTIDGTPYVLYAPDKVGNLSNLPTQAKSDIVSSIAELYDQAVKWTAINYTAPQNTVQLPNYSSGVQQYLIYTNNVYASYVNYNIGILTMTSVAYQFKSIISGSPNYEQSVSSFNTATGLITFSKNVYQAKIVRLR